MNKLNNIIGDKLSIALSSMNMFWIVTIMVTVPLFIERPISLIGWIQYLSTTILQAIALPLINFTTSKASNIQEKILRDTHDAVMLELKIAKTERRELKKIVKELNDVIKNNNDIVI